MKAVFDRLGNGLRVVVREARDSRVAAFQIWLGVGAGDETAEEAGMAHVLEHMMFKGTPRRGVGEIVRDIESAGGYVNAWTSHDETVFHVTMAADRAKRGLEVLADAVQNASIDEGELERERDVILEEIRMGADNPSRHVMEALFRRIFGKHSYGRPVIGTPRTVGGFDARAVRSFYKRWYTPENAVLVAVGDFDAEEIRREAKRLFGGWKARRVPKRAGATRPVARRGLSQAHRILPVFEAKVAVGIPIPGLLHDDVPILDLLAAVLGQGASSRLETIVRRDLALASDIRAAAYTPIHGGVFGVFAMTAPHRVDALVGAVTREIRRLTTERATPREIEKARSILMADAIYSEETVDGVARKLGYYATHAPGGDFERRYVSVLASADAAELLVVAQRHLDVRKLTVASVVPDPAVAAYEEAVPWISGERVRIERLEAAITRAVGQGEAKTTSRASTRAAAGTGVVELDTGDVLIVKPNRESRTVAVRAAFLGGVRCEAPAQAGLVSLLAASMTRGTQSRTPQEVSAAMDGLAATISGFAGRNTFGLHGEFLARNYIDGFSLFSECLRAPSFPEGEVAREREIQIDDIRAGRDDLEQQVFELFQAAMFGSHPYGRPLLGTEETVRGLTRDQLAGHLASMTAGGRMVLSVVGGADPSEVLDLVRAKLLARSATRARLPQPKPWKPAVRRRQVARSVDKEQSHIVLGFPGTTVASADRYAVEVLVEILGGHGGRLFAGVREKQGLAYSVSATSMEGLEPGYVALYAATAPGQENRVVEAMMRELDAMASRGPSRGELERVVNHLVGARLIGEQRAGARAATSALGYLYGLGPDSDAAYPLAMRGLKRSDIVDAAERYLDPARAVLAVVGADAENLRLL